MAFKQRARSDVEIKEVDYEWKITKFSYRSSNVGEKLWSPIFYSDNTKREEWQIRLYLNGDSDETRNSLSVYLCLNTSNRPSTSFRGTLSLLNLRNNTQMYKRVFNNTLEPGQQCGPVHFSKTFLEEKGECLSHDTLTLCCRLEIFQETSSMVTSSTASQLKSIIDDHQLAADLQHIFNVREHSDVVIIAGNSRFLAHKNILAARSSVFKEIFSKDDHHSDEVVIQDFSSDVVKAMLNYIYSDKIDHCKIHRLLMLADKYDLKGLKANCAVILIDQMNVDNVCHLLIYAHSARAEELKQAAINFICGREKEIFGTPQFRCLMKYPVLLSELYETSSRVHSGDGKVD